MNKRISPKYLEVIKFAPILQEIDYFNLMSVILMILKSCDFDRIIARRKQCLP